MKIILNLFMFMLLFLAVACEQTSESEDSIISESSITGDWTVNAYIDNVLIFGPFEISTQMTSENESVYIKDNGAFWNFQTEAKVTNSIDAFKTESSINEISNINAYIKILDGSIINNDSITFDIQFEDDETPYGFTYKIIGSRK